MKGFYLPVCSPKYTVERHYNVKLTINNPLISLKNWPNNSIKLLLGDANNNQIHVEALIIHKG